MTKKTVTANPTHVFNTLLRAWPSEQSYYALGEVYDSMKPGTAHLLAEAFARFMELYTVSADAGLLEYDEDENRKRLRHQQAMTKAETKLDLRANKHVVRAKNWDNETSN